MSEEPVPCPFCGGSDIRPSAHAGDTWVWCKNPKCPIYDVEIREREWDTRPDSKPYKYADICEAWLGTPAVGKIGVYDAFVMGFTVARERKE